MTARIPPATPPFSQDVQAQLDRIMPPGVPPLALFTLLANDARLFQRFMGAALLDKGNLTLRQREIVIDRITARGGCEYEWGVHIAFFGAKVGLDEAQRYSLVHGSADDGSWPQAAERALIRACDALHETCTLPQDVWNELADAFSESAILEVLMLAGLYRTVTYMANATALPLEPFAARFPARREGDGRPEQG
jgi:alkylhydroperoxidase family enzyme